MSDGARERWDRRWREDPLRTEPSEYLVSVADLLPSSGLGLDVAGGAGRNGFFLARRGLEVTLIDISPVAVDMARKEADRQHLAITAVELDLETEPLPAGPWSVILVFHYLQRSLFPALVGSLAPDGVIVCELATVRNLERHERPPLPYLVQEGELVGLLPGLRILDHSERWTEEGRHQARLTATR